MPDPYFQPADPMSHRRPYSWQTDEFQTKNEPRRTTRSTVENLPGARYAGFPAPPMQHPQALVQHQPAYLAGNYRCPRCGSNQMPFVERRISNAGWITFSILLVTTFVFFWVGLLMKENVSVCPTCRMRLG